MKLFLTAGLSELVSVDLLCSQEKTVRKNAFILVITDGCTRMKRCLVCFGAVLRLQLLLRSQSTGLKRSTPLVHLCAEQGAVLCQATRLHMRDNRLRTLSYYSLA